MGKIERIVADLPEDVFADIEQAVSAGEFGSVSEAVAHMAKAWVADRRADAPSFVARTRKAIEDSRADPHPGYPVDEVLAELDARYAAMIPDGDHR